MAASCAPSALFLLLHLALPFTLFGCSVNAQVVCRHDEAIPHAGGTGALRRSGSLGLRVKTGPNNEKQKRSIARCRGLVESVAVPEDATSYNGVPLAGVVSIVESEEAWTGDISWRRMTPICSGIFIGPDKILSSAHCVFHQRRSPTEARFWLFGDDSVRRRFFYAIAGKVGPDDPRVSVYPVQTACIPASYVAAANETVTSGQGNDVVVLTTLAPFRGVYAGLATFVDAIAEPEERTEFMLPQYPLDVARGAQLVIDIAQSPLYKTDYFGGVFYSVDLVSWIGSSGGAIVDVGASRRVGRPVVAGVLMSEGWQVCDSGMLPLTRNSHLLRDLVAVPPARAVTQPPVWLPPVAPIDQDPEDEDDEDENEEHGEDDVNESATAQPPAIAPVPPTSQVFSPAPPPVEAPAPPPVGARAPPAQAPPPPAQAPPPPAQARPSPQAAQPQDSGSMTGR